MLKSEVEAAEKLAAKMPEPFEVPNLDCFSIDPLDMAALGRTFDKLSRYCHHKRLSMQFRLKGQVSKALHHERIMDGIYKLLPKWARW